MKKTIRRMALGVAHDVLDTLYAKAKKAFPLHMRDRPPVQLHEIESNYMGRWDPDKKVRFVVSLIVGYDTKTAKSPEEAAAAALELTRDENSGGTSWYVYDRAAKTMHHLFQENFDPIELEAERMEKTALADWPPEAIDRLWNDIFAPDGHDTEGPQVSVEPLRELALEVVDTAKIMWGDHLAEVLASTRTGLEELVYDPPGTVAMRQLYHKARAVLAGLDLDERAASKELEQIAAMREEDVASSRRIAELEKELEVLDQGNPGDPLPMPEQK